MNIFHRSALVAYGTVAGLFFVLPALIICMVSQQSYFDFFVMAIGFLVPLLATGIALANWAGRSIPMSKLPSFVMSAVSLFAAVIGFIVFAGSFYPVGGFSNLTADGFRVLVVSALVMMMMGAPAALLAAILFIGGCQKSAR